MRGLLKIVRRRLGDDSGHVGVLMAMVIFVVVGMLMMTWNTAQLSKEKMRLQNAADSAALGFCVWQARGMNAVQNLNDEMYTSLSISIKLLNIATGFEIGAVALEPWTGAGVFGIIAMVACQAFHVIAMLTGGCSGLLASRICPWILRPLGYFYAYGSTALGWWGAQQFASQNRADPLGNVSLDFSAKFAGNFGLYALGVSYPFRDTVVLPLALVDDSDSEASREPWKHTIDRSEIFKRTRFSIYKGIHKLFGTGQKWAFKPWISKRDDKSGVGVTPGPSIWIAHKYYDHIETLPLDVWAKDFSGNAARKMPMMAVAAAQCIAGDVVRHSKKPEKGVVNQRVAGFGTGATAKLIPVNVAISKLNETAGKITGAIFYH